MQLQSALVHTRSVSKGLACIPINVEDGEKFESTVHEKISDKVCNIIKGLPRLSNVADMCDQAWQAVRRNSPSTVPWMRW